MQDQEGPNPFLEPESDADSFAPGLAEGLMDDLLTDLLASGDSVPIEETPAPVAEAEAPEPFVLSAEPPAPAEELQPEPPSEPEGATVLESIIAGIDSRMESAEPLLDESAEPEPADLESFVVLKAAGSSYAFPILDVLEVGGVPVVTRVPRTPSFVLGVTNLRGDVVPVLDLPALLGLDAPAGQGYSRILFVRDRERGPAAGFAVSEIKGLRRLGRHQMETIAATGDDKTASVLRGVHAGSGELVNVLDLEKLFSLPEFRQLGAS